MESVDLDVLIPRLQWMEAPAGSPGTGDSVAALDMVQCRLFLLEGELGVFLAADQNASVLTLDLEERKPKRVLCNYLQEGVFILLRTGGGGDYIMPVADRILATESRSVRECQRLWKSRLRSAVLDKGLAAACTKLKVLGSKRANELNVRNWIWDRTIKTRDYVDFEAIMQFSGLTDKAQELWQAMRKIDRAHKAAGQVIRRLLLQQVLQSDISQLRKYGTMDFELPQAGGRLTAYRVTGTTNVQVLRSVSQVGHPFALEGAMWQG
jgi:hypothetical protein